MSTSLKFSALALALLGASVGVSAQASSQSASPVEPTFYEECVEAVWAQEFETMMRALPEWYMACWGADGATWDESCNTRYSAEQWAQVSQVTASFDPESLDLSSCEDLPPMWDYECLDDLETAFWDELQSADVPDWVWDKCPDLDADCLYSAASSEQEFQRIYEKLYSIQYPDNSHCLAENQS